MQQVHKALEEQGIDGTVFDKVVVEPKESSYVVQLF